MTLWNNIKFMLISKLKAPQPISLHFLVQFSLGWGRILMPSMDKMTFTWSSSQFSVLDIHSTHAMLSTQASLLLHITVQPLQPTIPCPRKCPAIIFLTGHNFSTTHTLTTKIICNKSISILYVNYQNTKFIAREKVACHSSEKNCAHL